MRKNNVVIIPAKCNKSCKPFGIRVEKEEEESLVTWAFPLSEKSVREEHFDDSDEVSGKIVITSSYPGCPHCGAVSFIRCGVCHKVSCWDSETKSFVCPHCGNTCNEVVETSELESMSGGDY